jgi:hypothetical protein
MGILNRLFGKKPQPLNKEGVRSLSGKPRGNVQTAQPIPGTTGKPKDESVSKDEINRRVLPGNEVAEFLRGETVVFVHSSNVYSLFYKPETQQLIVTYLDDEKEGAGPSYEYDNISAAEAQQFMTNSSKGITVWDILRVRGSKNGARKPYRRLS